ncbi:Isonitrile hydratase [Psilocybe cubensis]|uniref:Isonitrile hydratase n=2 Tax=Psilocybe cubensis TaxID=181762 RepID=A0ACB8GKE2_PSICU|nr:Isonitrile hydratase [Psilocybe cubensis]KAH9475534.1 Isonitrile hydratase [Psilocybe cubensis]
MSSIIQLPPSARPADSVPLKYGIIVHSGFQALDVFGPLDALNALSLCYPLQLFIIAETLDPVSTKPPGSLGNPTSNFAQSIVPTHTFDTVPALDVLIVPGGVGNRIPEVVARAIEYIADVYPSLQFLLTVCTGSRLVAEAGVLDGRKATTNKAAWARTIAYRPQVNWVPHARWVVDGNIWTASGVSAGIDLIFAYIGEVYGEEVATLLSNFMEYERHQDSTWDPYAELYSL